MLSNRKSVLCFGMDQMLLDTRQQLLERSGYVVHSTTEKSVAKKCLLNGDVAVLILCHTLTRQELENITSFHREMQSTALILCLTIETGISEPDCKTVVYDTHDGPGAFIAVVEKLYAASNVPA